MRPSTLRSHLAAPLAALVLLAAPLAAHAADGNHVWAPDPLKSLLGTFGYTDLSNLQRNGATYTADATRYGVQLHGITIDAQTGDVLVAPTLTVAQTGTLLASKGYTAVSAVRPFTNVAGNLLAARATDAAGVTGTWLVDPWTGAVYPAADAD